MYRETGIALFFFIFITIGYPQDDSAFLDGEWALKPSGQTTTSILRFHKDGMVDNTITSVTGKYQFLNDERVLIEFDDGLMIGKLDKTNEGYRLKGIFYPPSQRIEVEFSPPTKKKRDDAQAFQDELINNLTQVQKANIEQAIMSNLAAFAAAAQMQMLLEGTTEVGFPGIVGPDKLVPQLQNINGEVYKDLIVTHETQKLTVIDKDGNEYVYEF